jgi:peroxygenase
MHRTKHGSDSETYDTEGRFVPDKFEAIFSKFDKEGKGGLNLRDIGDMVHQNMNVNDFVGWIAERLEWYTFYLLAANEDGIITKEKIRAMYDGSLFEMIAAEREHRKPFVAGKQARPHAFPIDNPAQQATKKD